MSCLPHDFSCICFAWYIGLTFIGVVSHLHGFNLLNAFNTLIHCCRKISKPKRISRWKKENERSKKGRTNEWVTESEKKLWAKRMNENRPRGNQNSGKSNKRHSNIVALQHQHQCQSNVSCLFSLPPPYISHCVVCVCVHTLYNIITALL